MGTEAVVEMLSIWGLAILFALWDTSIWKDTLSRKNK